MKKLIALFALFTATQAFAVDTKIKTDKVLIGKTAAGDKTIELNKGSGSANPKIKWDNTTSKIRFSNDGTNFKDLGSGAGGGSGINMLQDSNADFEQGTTSWTASGGSFAMDTSSNLFHDQNSAAFDASASSQTLSSANITVTSSNAPGLKGGAGWASCYIKTAATDYKLQVYDGTNVIGERTIPAQSQFQEFGVGFPIPTSGTIRLRVISASDAAAIYLDDCFMGEHKLAQVSQASWYGAIEYPAAASCLWSMTSPEADISANGSCATPVTYGNALAPSTKIPGIRFASLPKGFYRFVVKATTRTLINANANDSIVIMMSDGTNHFGRNVQHVRGLNSTEGQGGHLFEMEKEYTTELGDTTFRLRARTGGGSAPAEINNTLTTYNQVFRIDVYRFPTAADAAFRVDNASAHWTGYSSGSWSTTSTSYADPGTAAHTLTELKNRNFGTVSGTSNLPQITFTPPRVGRYWVCANTFIQATANSLYGSARLYDGTSTIAETGVRVGTNAASAEVTLPLCGLYDATSIASTTLKVQIKTSNGANSIGVYNGNQRGAVEWTLVLLDTPSAAPVFPGNVTSNTTGSERIERASITGGNPPSIARQSGSWLTYSSRPGAGDYIFTMSGFSATPSCTCTMTASSSLGACKVAIASSTSFEVNLSNNTGSGTSDGDFHIICMGPK